MAKVGDVFKSTRDDLLTALALTEFSVHYEDVNPELSRRAWQLAADRLVDYDVDRPEGLVFREVTRVQLSATERHVDAEALEQLLVSSDEIITDQFIVQEIRLDVSPEGVDVPVEE